LIHYITKIIQTIINTFFIHNFNAIHFILIFKAELTDGHLTDKSYSFRLIDHGQLASAKNHAVAVNISWSFNQLLD
jgi:hypothetical protein